VRWATAAAIVAALVSTMATAFAVLSGGSTALSAGPYLAPAGCVVGPTDLIAWWRGENGLTAEIGPDLVGMASFTDAAIGRGLVLDEQAVLSADALATVSTGVTVDAWIKPTAMSGSVQMIVSRWDFPSTDDSARSYALMLDVNGDVLWTTDETTTRRPEELRASPPPTVDLFDGAFHHVAATWDSSQMTIYLDGNAIGSQPSQGGVLNPASTTPLRIGSKAGIGPPLSFSGVIDEPSVARRALSATEIADLVNAGPAGKCAISVSEGTPSYARGSGARVKGYNTGAEIFVGPMTSGSATPRAEANVNQFQTVGQASYQLSFTYEQVANVLSVTLTPAVDPPVTTTYDLDTDSGGGCAPSAWDTIHLVLVDSRIDSAVSIGNVVVDGFSIGNFGTLDRLGTPGARNWHIARRGLGDGFTVTATLNVDGYLGNEATKVEFAVGCSP